MFIFFQRPRTIVWLFDAARLPSFAPIKKMPRQKYKRGIKLIQVVE